MNINDIFIHAILNYIDILLNYYDADSKYRFLSYIYHEYLKNIAPNINACPKLSISKDVPIFTHCFCLIN